MIQLKNENEKDRVMRASFFSVFAWKITTIKKLLSNNNKTFEGLISKDQKQKLIRGNVSLDLFIKLQIIYMYYMYCKT